MMIPLENPAVLNQPPATPSIRVRRATFSALLSENREHLGYSPSFSSDFLPLSRPSSSLYLSLLRLAIPFTVHPFALALLFPASDVQRAGTSGVAASSQRFPVDHTTNPTRIPYPFPALSMNGFHRRGLDRSSPFLPLSRFRSVFLLPASIYPSSCSPVHPLDVPRGLADWLLA